MGTPDRSPEPVSEVDELFALLWMYRTDERADTKQLAQLIAQACLGDNHLWQDMGLPNRNALSELLRLHFHALYELNSGNMKWKKFLYKQLCESAGHFLCKAPNCKVCTDYSRCFASEDGAPLSQHGGR